MDTHYRGCGSGYGACARNCGAQSVGGVENARAKERQGTYLSPQDRENLRRYGGNDVYGPSYGYGPYYGGAYYGGYYGYGDGYGPGVSIYLGD